MARKMIGLMVLVALAGVLLGPAVSMAATEQAKRQAINDGLAWLASQQVTSGTQGYWTDSNGTDGYLAATASAALAFIEEGYLPGDGSAYDGVVTKACNYVFNRATAQGIGWETAGYARHAEDYNNNGILDDGGNNQAIYFNPGGYSRSVYTTGIVAPMVYALGQKLGPNTVIGRGSAAVSSMTYKQAMQDVVDWFSWGQVEPNTGNYRGGWRYYPNYSSSDNSTAQWGALPMLYAQSWGLGQPQYVANELNLWVNYIQNPMDAGIDWKDGGSGYTNTTTYVNMAKTGGLLLELAAMGVPLSDQRVQDALYYMTSMELFDHWNQGATSYPDQWNGGHLNNPYAMWAVYKALEVYGFTGINDNGTPGDTSDDFLIGSGISTAPGGFTIGQDWGTQTSLAGDWYSHYCDYLVGLQNTNGSWNGYSPWTGALAAGWYINILNAAGAPPPFIIPEPSTFVVWALLGACAIGFRHWRRRRAAA